MNAERWRQVKAIFHRAVESDPEERAVILRESCGDDEELQREVEALLDYDRAGEPLLEHPLVESGAMAAAVAGCGVDPLVGRSIGNYTITGELAHGGMGIVYRARHAILPRDAVVKCIRALAFSGAERSELRTRFRREAHIQCQLDHPNIVRLYEFFAEGDDCFLVMEYVHGSSLEAMLRQGAPLPAEQAIALAVQALDGLAHAHGLHYVDEAGNAGVGIIHRDIKPANFLIDEQGNLKLTDFGIVKVLGESHLTRTGFSPGTVDYMSPEQIRGLPVDARSDLYSMGVTLYEMLTGRVPFPRSESGSGYDVLKAHVETEPVPVETWTADIPAPLAAIVTRSLKREANERWQSAAEFREALTACQQKRQVRNSTAPPALPTKSGLRRPSRYKIWVPLVAATGVLGAVAFLILGPSRDTGSTPLHASVLTSFLGDQDEPSLSPDGNQFAFAWDGDVAKGQTHVYISLLGRGAPLRLTPENEVSAGPSWSPDGQSIAYRRRPVTSAASELVVMPALGGPVRSIASGSYAHVAAWSPDSKWLLWSQRAEVSSRRQSIHAAPAVGGGAHKLLDPPPDSAGDLDPAVSPDGHKLTFSRCLEDFDCDVYVAGYEDGKLTGTPRQITHDRTAKRSPRWTNGGREIVYISGEITSELSIYRVPSSGGVPRRVEGIGANARNLTLAEKSKRLLYSTLSINYDIWRTDLSAAHAKPERFLASTRFEASPAYSPDGNRIAFSSNRSGVRQIWVADSSGANPSPLTSFSSGIAGNPKWSPDGQTIVFEARPEANADIYTVPAGGGALKRLTDDPGQDHVPSWSPDGKWIYFGSTRAGGHDVFRMRPDGSEVRQITHNGGYYGVVGPDGKWLYYSVPAKGLWKALADGGEATQVLPRESLCLPFSFVVTARGIYALGALQHEAFPVMLYPFEGGKPRTLTTLTTSRNLAPVLFPEVSPDGRWLLYAAADDAVTEIMLVENFR